MLNTSFEVTRRSAPHQGIACPNVACASWLESKNVDRHFAWIFETFHASQFSALIGKMSVLFCSSFLCWIGPHRKSCQVCADYELCVFDWLFATVHNRKNTQWTVLNTLLCECLLYLPTTVHELSCQLFLCVRQAIMTCILLPGNCETHRNLLQFLLHKKAMKWNLLFYAFVQLDEQFLSEAN